MQTARRRQGHKLDLPSHPARRGADGALQVEENQQGDEQNEELERASRPTHGNRPSTGVSEDD